MNGQPMIFGPIRRIALIIACDLEGGKVERISVMENTQLPVDPFFVACWVKYGNLRGIQNNGSVLSGSGKGKYGGEKVVKVNGRSCFQSSDKKYHVPAASVQH